MGFKWERMKLNGGSIRLNGGLSIAMFDYQRGLSNLLITKNGMVNTSNLPNLCFPESERLTPFFVPNSK